MTIKNYIYINGWKEVSYEEFEKFNGKKMQAPSLYRVALRSVFR